MKRILYLSLLIGINVQAETVFKIDNKKQNEFQVIDSKNQWLSAEEKCNIIESYNTIGDWNPEVLNQSSSFNQERTIQNFDRISCIMQEYNERLNQYREIGESTIKVEERESDIENRLINVTDTGLTEIGEVFNCGAYTPSLNTILSVGTFNVSQSCQQNQEGKYLYSTGESYTYNTSVKNKNINKSVVATKENETINNISCTSWIDKSSTISTVTQERSCSKNNKYDIVLKFNNEELQKNNINETKNELESRVVNIECEFSGPGSGNHSYVYISNQRDIRNYDGATFIYNECGFYFRSNYIYSTTQMNMCESTIKNGYKYMMSDHKYDAAYEQEGPYYTTVTDESLFQICRYKID